MDTNPTLLPEEAATEADLLHEFPLLAALPPELLTEVARHARRLSAPAGQLVMQEGTAGDGLYLLVDGELEVTRRCGDQEVVLAVFGSGAVVGEMSLVEHHPRSASVRAVRDSELLVIEPAEFEKLIERSPSISLSLLRTVLARLRGTEASLVQHGKLASLGTMAAGLAHELNNPSAALLRGLPQLRTTLAELEHCAMRVGGIGLVSTLESRLANGLDAVATPSSATLPFGLEAMKEEDRLLDWLEALGVEHAAGSASALQARGWTPERLENLLDGLEAPHAAPVLRWLAARCAVSSLLEDLTRSVGAIAEIVAAVRSHSALGQPALRRVDVVQGLESALAILRGRLSEGVTVVREYGTDLPEIEAYGAELNHVWSNLLENALDALQGRGTLNVRVARSEDGVVIQVTDDGPGIAGAILPRIFDPFFTTKPLGAGTGLGLHIAYSAVRRHRGSIRVESRPGRTTFTVVLPLRLRDQP
jgi:signal transduction histidine kinase